VIVEKSSFSVPNVKITTWLWWESGYYLTLNGAIEDVTEVVVERVGACHVDESVY
jgi:hypothetical protein